MKKNCVQIVVRFNPSHRERNKMREPLEKAELEARNIGRILKANMPKGWGFVLLLVSHGEKGVTTYLSDCCREDIIKFFKEMIYKFESNEGEI